MLHWQHIKGFNGTSDHTIYSVIEWSRYSYDSTDTDSSSLPKLALLASNPTSNVFDSDEDTGRLAGLKSGINGVDCGFLVTTAVNNRFTGTNTFNDTYFTGISRHINAIFLANINSAALPYSGRIYFNVNPQNESLTDSSYITASSQNLQLYTRNGLAVYRKVGNNYVHIGSWGGNSSDHNLIVGPNTDTTPDEHYNLLVKGFGRFNSFCQAKYFTASSDIRAKENLNLLQQSMLNIVRKINIYTFNYKTEPDPKDRTIGVIAQELQDIDIDGFSLVGNKEATGENGDFMMIRESKLIYVLLGAVKELSEEVDRLKKKLGE